MLASDLSDDAQVTFESLLVASLDDLMGQALRLARSRAGAEDLVQETAARALRARAQFTLGTNFRAWVGTILTHTFIHSWRHSRREREATLGEGESFLREQLGLNAQASHRLAPDAKVTFLAFGDEVHGALASLSEDFREVVTLADIDGLSYRAIAQALGCPMGTVMSRLHRARRALGGRLRDFARDQGIASGDLATAAALAA